MSWSKRRLPIPPDVISQLEKNEVSLPFKILLQRDEKKVGDTGLVSTLVIRQINEDDVGKAMRLCVLEYGSYSSSSSLSSKNGFAAFMEKQWMYYENFAFSVFVSLGLLQRVMRRKQSEESIQNGDDSRTQPIPSDHNVICIAELNDEGEEEIVGIAEISLQPPDPYRTSAPFVIPLEVKKYIAKLSNVPPPMPYISNVLIKREFRGLGYSKILMAACEGIAREWGYTSIYLHVDADVSSGAAAQNLYRGLGYESITDIENNQKFNWIGPEMMQKGLYMVEGVPLLFLKKDVQ